MPVPDPALYASWDEWATSIRDYLDQNAPQSPLNPIPFLPVYAVANVPSPSRSAGLIFISDETGGAVPAFSDGSNWRRVTDRAIIS